MWWFNSILAVWHPCIILWGKKFDLWVAASADFGAWGHPTALVPTKLGFENRAGVLLPSSVCEPGWPPAGKGKEF